MNSSHGIAAAGSPYSRRLKEDIYRGAVLWSVFALVETLFASVLSSAFNPSLLPPHGVFTIVAFFLYAAFGALLGGLLGLGERILRPNGNTDQTALSSHDILLITPPLLMAAHLAYVYPAGFLLAEELGLAILLLVLLKKRKSSISTTRRLDFVTSPWLVCVATLGVPWLARELFSHSAAPLKGTATILFLLAVFTLAFLLMPADTAARRNPHRKRPFRFMVVAVLILASAFIPEARPLITADATPSGATDGPNILLISMDTVRADHMSAYGYARDTTPTLSKLAQESVLYTRSMSTGDMTLLSHASIFTGLYPRVHGAHYDPDNFPDGRPLADHIMTLTELLADAGYATYAVVANSAYLHRDFGMSKGFGYYDDRMLRHFFQSSPEYYLRNWLRDFLKLFSPPEISDLVFRQAWEINAEASSLIEEVSGKQRPFFMFLNYMDAHWPYIPPAPFDEYYPGKLPGYTSKRFYHLKEQVSSLKGDITDAERDHLVSQYDGGIAYLDARLGELFDKLRENDLYDNTMIIVTSDHGEVFGRRNFIEHAVSVYADQIHVPLIIKYPGSAKTGTEDGLVSGIDILPTVLDVAGQELTINLPGLALSRESPPADRMIFGESYQNAAYYDWHPRFHRTQRAAMQGSAKGVFTDDGTSELYDLVTDPLENNNILNEQATVAAELKDSMDEWLDTNMPLTKSGGSVDEELRERLRSLGYIQ